MKVVYFGSSQFSKIILEGLVHKGFIPVLIVSKPDRPKGRGLNLFPTEVSLFAEKEKISLIKPVSLKNKVVEEELRKTEADFFIVADYGKIIPLSVLSIPKIFSLAVHPSLLPRYRGPAPIEYAIINGEKETGLTIFVMNERVDSGDVILKEKVIIEDRDDFFTLREKLALKGVSLLVEAINKIVKGDYKLSPQDEAEAILTSKLKKEDGKISWRSSAMSIRNLIRATLGWPSAYTHYNDLAIKVLRAEVIAEESSALPGTIVKIDKEGIQVATSKGILKILKLKPQGKKEMDAWSFVCGHRVKVGEKFK